MCVCLCIYIYLEEIYIYIYIYIHILIFSPTVKLVTSNPLQQKSELYCIMDGVNPIRHISLCISGLLSQ